VNAALDFQKVHFNLDDCMKEIIRLQNDGVPFQGNRIWRDQFRRSDRDQHFVALGVARSTQNIVKGIEPNGAWQLEITPPNTTSVEIVLQPMQPFPEPELVKSKHYEASAWYSRFLPYAYGMFQAEWDFQAKGINYESINAYYGTVMGFQELANDRNRIIAEDRELFNKIQTASHFLKPPRLPFDEVFLPCVAYVCYHRPDLYAQGYDEDHWFWDHAVKTCEKAGLTPPKF
jgi:hypothetical protein